MSMSILTTKKCQGCTYTFLGGQPPEGEYRVALNASKFMMTFGMRGYFFMMMTTSSGRRRTYPPPALEHQSLYLELTRDVLSCRAAHMKKILPWTFLLLVPFCIMLALGGATDGMDGNPFFLIGFVVSFCFPFVVITSHPFFHNRDDLEIIVQNQAPRWSEETEYRLSLEEDTTNCPSILYLCFRKVDVDHEATREMLDRTKEGEEERDDLTQGNLNDDIEMA